MTYDLGVKWFWGLGLSVRTERHRPPAAAGLGLIDEASQSGPVSTGLAWPSMEDGLREG